MLLGALPLEAELHKRRLSLLHSVVSSENECLKGLVQRQLACSFNIQNSFFFIVSNILEKYGLPSLSQLICSNYNKLQWKHIYFKAINNVWTKQFVCEIKTKKTLKYLSVYNLQIGTSHLVWRSLDASVPDVRKGIIRNRILTGTYLLQKHRHSFCGGTVDPVDWRTRTCCICWLVVQHSLISVRLLYKPWRTLFSEKSTHKRGIVTLKTGQLFKKFSMCLNDCEESTCSSGFRRWDRMSIQELFPQNTR